LKTSPKIYKNFKISFIKRQTNSIVYLLTTVSLSYFSFPVHDYITSCICWNCYY